jgi:hypothetical protein
MIYPLDLIHHHISVGSHPPSYIRWIPSTIIYPLDPIPQLLSHGSSRYGLVAGGEGEGGPTLELEIAVQPEKVS